MVIDETGYLKKGQQSAGVARQYSGTAGRIENCQIGVFLAYASSQGHALLDCALYLPQDWTSDDERCQSAGVPEKQPFATKPQLARQLLTRAFDAQVPAAWVTGDSVYGDDRRLRVWLEERAQAYVLAVSGKEYVWCGWRQHQVTSSPWLKPGVSHPWGEHQMLCLLRRHLLTSPWLKPGASRRTW